MHGICVCVGNVSSDAEKANCNIDQHNDYSWVDELGSELGKRNLTYLTPEEDFSENVSIQAQLDLDYFKTGPDSEPTVYDVIEVIIGHYLHAYFQKNAVKNCIYCIYMDNVYRERCRSCHDVLPSLCLEGHMEEIKRGVFNDNYTTAQSFVLYRLGMPAPNTQDIAEDVLKKWLTTPFLKTRLKQLMSGVGELNAVVRESLEIWSRKHP